MFGSDGGLENENFAFSFQLLSIAISNQVPILKAIKVEDAVKEDMLLHGMSGSRYNSITEC